MYDSLRSALFLALGLATAFPGAIEAQRDTLITPGARYSAGAIHRALFGSDYRDVWTTPARVPVLNLETFAGGLQVVREGGGEQTRALRLRGSDGREYNFRSVDKDAGRGLPRWLRGTPVEWVLQDQTSSLHPAAAGITASLMDAVGVLHPRPRLIVLPDDPRLGPFREEFAGMLGWIEVHPEENRERPELGFLGAPRVAGTERVLEHLREEPELNRVDAEAYLRLRLVDILVADWDRHAGQLRWVRTDTARIHVWTPIAEDRDYAFVSYDGALTKLARWLLAPRAYPYRAEYRSDLFHLVKSGLELDRRLLAGLPDPAWEAATLEVQSRITDEAIDAALRTMPVEWQRASAGDLRYILRARRDELAAQSERFRELVRPGDQSPARARSPD